MTNQQKSTVVAIVGPTGSGKTALSLALAEQLNAEIIACDSRTIYKYFDVGTAKPTKDELARVRHHLIDVIEAEENFTVAKFADSAALLISDLGKRGKTPIVCGGTGFYARALLEGLVMPDVQPQEELRKELNIFADEKGNEALWNRLNQVDSATAVRLNVNDRFRIIRALEVHAVAGKPMSEVATKSQPPYHTIWIGLTTADRANLHDRIKQRFQQQLDDGLLAETERLYKRYGAHQRLLHTVNYKQIVEFLEGKTSEEAAYVEAIHRNVGLARKQLIWFRSNPEIRWFAVDQLAPEELIEAVRIYINESILLRRS